MSKYSMMKPLINILLIWVIFSSCSSNTSDQREISYLKVVINGDTQIPNEYNKGVGILFYAYFDLIKDSLFFLYPEYSGEMERDQYRHHAYEAKLENTKLRDTLLQLIHALKWRPSGLLTNIPETATYCGWEYFVEFNNGGKVRYYNITAGISDTLDRFIDIVTNLEKPVFAKKPADPKRVNIDKEVVAEMKLFGVYDNRAIPYRFPECDSGIDFSHLTGIWRTVGTDYRNTKRDRFVTYTLYPDKTFIIKQYKDGVYTELVRGTYSVNTKTRKILYKPIDGEEMTQLITQLSDSCFSVFETYPENRKRTKYFNRY